MSRITRPSLCIWFLGLYHVSLIMALESKIAMPEGDRWSLVVKLYFTEKIGYKWCTTILSQRKTPCKQTDRQTVHLLHIIVCLTITTMSNHYSWKENFVRHPLDFQWGDVSILLVTFPIFQYEFYGIVQGDSEMHCSPLLWN